MQNLETYLAKWVSASLVDEATAGRIRSFEAAEQQPAGQRWQVLIALGLGGILLGAGILLFVAAHWDQVSPFQRLALVISMLAALHLGAVAVTEKFPAMATALHGVGTVACGAAIAMVGQIFNMDEHWPAAIMLWAICAGVGWWLLRDQFQQICTLLLIPVWLICEWSYRASIYRSQEVYLFRMVAVLGAVYLTAFVHSRRRTVFGVLFAIAGLALLYCFPVLTEGWQYYGWRAHLPMPMELRVTAILLIALIALGGYFVEKKSLLPTLSLLVTVFALPWLQTTVQQYNEFTHQTYSHTGTSLFAYILVATVTVILAAWGVQQRSRAIVNYGVGTFALTVGWFYFASLMDKLGRSLGLIGLGIVFLLGGWFLERLRRRLIQEMRSEAMPS
jgi:uncharacterized membrane protein